jgi:hypothetical protein
MATSRKPQAKPSRARILASNLRHLQVLELAAGAFKQARIPFLCLKGAAYLDTLFPDLSEREMCDVDVLVSANHRPQARRALEDFGFWYTPPPPTHEGGWDGHYSWHFRSPDHVLLELHAGFCQFGRYSIDYPGVWERSVTYPVEGRAVTTLSPEDSLLYAAVHEAKHSFALHASAREDVRRIIETWRPDWKQVVERAREWGAASSVYVTLLASRKYGASVPAWVLTKLRPGAARRAALHALVRLEGDCNGRWPASWPVVQAATALAFSDRNRQNLLMLSHYANRRTRDLWNLGTRRRSGRGS